MEHKESTNSILKLLLTKCDKMKYLSMYLMSLFFVMSGCKSNEDIFKPVIEPPTTRPDIKVSLSSKKIVVFNHVISSGGVTPLKESEIENYFGERIAFSIPESIVFKNDSTFLVKPFDLVEKFKSKWEGDKLYLQLGDKQSWKQLGEKSNEKDFKLNMTFYAQKKDHAPATRLVLGQEYHMNLDNPLFSKTDQFSSLTWLTFDLLYN